MSGTIVEGNLLRERQLHWLIKAVVNMCAVLVLREELRKVWDLVLLHSLVA